MKELMWFMGVLTLVTMLVAVVGRAEYADGYAAGAKTVKTTDQQCVAWLFEANMKDVKRKICR